MNVGQIGLGSIGRPIALRLVRAGHNVTAFDIRASELNPAELGDVVSVGSVADAISGAEVVITVLPTSDDVRRALLSDESRGALGRGTVCVDMTTGYPAATREIASELADCGVAMIDAAICNGGVPAAEQGSLTLVVGGDNAAIEAASPVLAAVASSVIHAGDLGTGQTIKLLNNAVVMASAAVLAEVIAVAEAYGLDRTDFTEVLSHCSASNWMKLPAAIEMVVPDPAPQRVFFKAEMAAKDLSYARDLSVASSMDSPLITATSQVYAAAVDAGLADSEAVRAPLTHHVRTARLSGKEG